MSDVAIWHDLECGAYESDLPLWRALADQANGPILDVGAGTGRVALDLARRGHEVVALDVDPQLLDTLAQRAQGVPIETLCADARSFELPQRFALVVVPMQTVQLLPGAPARAQFLGCARAHLADGGRLAMAIADPLDDYDDELAVPPTPDMREIDGVVYASTPMRLVDLGARVAIERTREIVDAAGNRTVSEDVVWLEHLDAAQLEDEATEAGFTVLERTSVAATDVYVGSAVVMLGV